MSVTVKDDGLRYRSLSNGAMVKLCNAKLEGRQCNHAAISGRNYCAFHGGKNPIAHETAQFSHGLYSTSRKRFSTIGQQMLERINELREDPELFSLKDDAAYITAIIDQRAEAAAEGVSAQLLKDLRETYLSAARAYRAGDIPEFQDQFKTLGEMLTSGANAVKATDEVLDLIGRRVDIVEAEQRMVHAKAYTLEVDQAYSLINQILGVIKSNVRNVDEVQAIKLGFGKILKTYKTESDDNIIDAEVVDEEA